MPFSRTLYRNLHVRQQRALYRRADLRHVEPLLVEDEELARTAKAEVRRAAGDLDLAQQRGPGRPHLDAIAAAAVHVALQIALDAVGDACLVVSPVIPRLCPISNGTDAPSSTKARAITSSSSFIGLVSSRVNVIT